MNLPPIDTSGINIAQLPVKFKRVEAGDRFLVPVESRKCRHWQGPFEVDVHGGACKCKACGETVTPMFVLERLMSQESNWRQTHDRYQEEMKRLAERSRTKCDHCGKMTGISHK